jgi:hypothetical protein
MIEVLKALHVCLLKFAWWMRVRGRELALEQRASPALTDARSFDFPLAVRDGFPFSVCA